MRELSQPTKHLIQLYQTWYNALQQKEGIATIHVDEVASKVASFYEKMRGVIDWREEHLLRKTAIERIIKRRLFLKKNRGKIAEPLVYELIRGGHFPNDAIPEERIIEVQKLIDKYIFILDNAPPPQENPTVHTQQKLKLYDWILGIAACEIEETLSLPKKEKSLMDYMLTVMKEQIEIRKGISLSEEDKDTQIYIAIQRTLFKLDPPLISYNLLKKRYPEWSNLPQEKLQEIAKNIYLIWENLKRNLKHPLAEKFYKICERYDTPYLILGDIISGDPLRAKENLETPEVLEVKIKNVYNERLKRVKAKMGRAAIYGTVSIFLTKMLVAFAIEVPYDKLTNQFSYFTIGLSILIPSLLMFLLILSIKPPSRQNAELTTMEVMKIAYEREGKDIYEIKPSPKRGLILNAIMVIFYLLSFIASFGAMIWGLQKLNFSFVSIIIFMMFVSLISFAGVKIRQRAKELVVEKEKETFFRTFFDIFSLPFVQMGRWLSTQWAKYNVLAVLFNSLLDMPFQVFIEFLEQWRAFLKEKKEKIY